MFTLSNPTRRNPNSALATKFTLPAEDNKEVFSINGGNIERWEESLQRRGYIHTEPQDLVLFEDDPTFRASFERVSCMNFC